MQNTEDRSQNLKTPNSKPRDQTRTVNGGLQPSVTTMDTVRCFFLF